MSAIIADVFTRIRMVRKRIFLPSPERLPTGCDFIRPFKFHISSFNREIEIGVGVRFVAKREVPPFAVKRFEAVAKHSIAQYHTVAELLLGYTCAVACIFSYFRVKFRVRIAAIVGM